MPKKRTSARFANTTEADFGRLLQRLRLRWEYEPHTFVLRTKPDGTPALAFTPDFYLPDLNVYFELTTLRQKLVTLKNRKARLLAEQRPDVRLRILYRRDCQDVLRPARTRRAREAVLRKLLAAPPEDTLRRVGWVVYLQRRTDLAGRVSVMGVWLPLSIDWAGKQVNVWVYPGILEIERDGAVIARFPCSYDERSRMLASVEPGELLLRPDMAQGTLALPELDRRPLPGRRLPGRVRLAAHAIQPPLSL
ncbi:MAG: hypothetical protein M3506_07665 [Chloroflexota bacterium]|nr:hypothetical protein [Chloroflexota bacterium]